MSTKLDTVVLVTGDGDFVPLVKYLQNHGCQVEVVSFGKSTSAKLIEAADDFYDLDQNPKKFLIGAWNRERRPMAKQHRGGKMTSSSPAALEPTQEDNVSMHGTDTDQI